MTVVAVAGLSARVMAEAAALDGFDVVALDVFGDLDTCAAASRWIPIGGASPPRIDAERTLAALAGLKRQRDLLGWIPGSGFEALPALWARGAAALPLLGTAAGQVARLRDPAAFFGLLAAHDIEHPCWQRQAPGEHSGWLLKNARACGGGHVRAADATGVARAGPHDYFQRRVSGLPMSATFVANGQGASVLGFNRQIVRRIGTRPHVYCGVVGPVRLPDPVARQLQRAVDAVAEGFALRGLCSLDFMLDAARPTVLEVNPRPPASLALYRAWRPMAAHVQACLGGGLPAAVAPDGVVNGSEIVFARRPLTLSPALAQALARAPDVHDLPRAGQALAAGDPLCSVEARAATVAEVLARLDNRREELSELMENLA